jgi:hypothetical protein
MNAEGALLGPFAPMLHYPQFGVPALSFLRTLDVHATIDKRVREVAILTVGAAYGARFELYAHEIMARAFGLSPDIVASLAAGVTFETTLGLIRQLSSLCSQNNFALIKKKFHTIKHFIYEDNN